VNEPGFSHAAARLYTTRYANAERLTQLFGPCIAKLRKDVRNGVCEVESLSIWLETQLSNLLNALLPLAQQIVF
jgi:hypothetical protein